MEGFHLPLVYEGGKISVSFFDFDLGFKGSSLGSSSGFHLPLVWLEGGTS